MRFGMDFGGTNLKAGIFDESGRSVSFIEKPLSEFAAEGDLLDNLIAHAETIAKGHTITAAGLAIKGLVNARTGIMEDDVGAGSLLTGADLRKPFADALNCPFAVENDARAYAWGEWKFGAGKNSAVMICMTLGTGVGCALVKDQQPYIGADTLGGILGGHISIDKNGPECPCGNRGCLELYCSAPALTKRVNAAHPEFADVTDPLPRFFDLAARQGSTYQKTLYHFQDDLAIGMVNAIHAYGPDCFVLGGGVMNSAELILLELRQIVQRRAWTIPRGKVKIRAAALGNRAAAMGVAFHPDLEVK